MSTAHDTHALLAHVGWVRALAAELVHDGATAEDLAQETLLAAWQRPPRDPSALRAYLRSVLRNLLHRGARDADRRAARERGSARGEALPSAAETAERLATHRQIVAAVDALPEPYRSTVLLRHFEELPPRRIAEHLGIPVKTVETRLTRGHALLRERLDADHGGDRRACVLALARFAGSDPIGRPPPGRLGPATPWIVGAGVVAAAGVLALLTVLRGSALRAARQAERAMLAEQGAVSELSGLGYTASGGERVQLEVQAGRTWLRGRVVSGAGEPIAGAEITVKHRPADGMRLRLGSFGEAEEDIGTVTSGGDGSWELDVPARRLFDVRVRARGFGVGHRALVDPEARLEIRLDPAATLALSVADESGAAVPGARVKVFAPVDLASGRAPLVESTTDSRGRWRSEALPPGVYRVEVASMQAPTIRLANVALRSGDVVDREVRLHAGVEIAGVVRGARTGKGLAGAEVRLDGDARGTSDGEGRYRIEGADPTDPSARVQIASLGYSSADVAVDPRGGPAARADAELLRGHGVAGRLRSPGGGPVAGAWVAAYGHVESAAITPTDWVETRSGADGAFALEGLRSDLPHALFVRSAGLATLVRPLPRGADGERVDLGEVAVPAGASLEGRVTRDDGAPAAGAVVMLEPADTPKSPRSATTVVVGGGSSPPEARGDDAVDPGTLLGRDAIAADDGSFRMHDLAPGRWRAVARINFLRSRPIETELVPGSAVKDLRLEIPRGLAIEGRIVDDADRLLPGAWVLLFRKGKFPEERSVEADVDGRFRIDGLEAVPYRLTAGSSARGSESYGRTESGDVVPPQVEIVLRLERTVRVEGRVLDAAGRPLARALVDGCDADGRHVQSVSDASGRFRLEVAANARLDLRGSWPGPGADASDGRSLSGTLPGVASGAAGVVLTLDGSH